MRWRTVADIVKWHRTLADGTVQAIERRRDGRYALTETTTSGIRTQARGTLTSAKQLAKLWASERT